MPRRAFTICDRNHEMAVPAAPAGRQPLTSPSPGRLASAQRGIVAYREIDPFWRRPVGMFGADLRTGRSHDGIGILAGLALGGDAPAEVDHVIADGFENFGPAEIAMAGYYNGRVPGNELSQHLRPARAGEVRAVRREPRKDRENAFLGKVAGEQDALLRQPHHLVAGGMREPPGAQFDRAAAEIDRRRRAFVNVVRLDEFCAFQRGGDAGAEGLEHAEIAFALGGQLIALRAIVVDARRALEDLRTESVLGMKVCQRSERGTVGG